MMTDMSATGNQSTAVDDAGLVAHARTRPDHVALRQGEETRTYAELDDRARRVAHALAGLGVRRGDRVAVMVPNSFEFFEAVHGSGRLGAVVVPVNIHFKADEAGWIVEDSGASAVVVAEDLQPALAGVPDVPRLVVGQGGDYEAALATRPEQGEVEPPETVGDLRWCAIWTGCRPLRRPARSFRTKSGCRTPISGASRPPFSSSFRAGARFFAMELDLGAGFRLRPATPADMPAFRCVCLLTGDAGEDASHLHDDPDLSASSSPCPTRCWSPSALSPWKAQPVSPATCSARSIRAPSTSAWRANGCHASGPAPAIPALTRRIGKGATGSVAWCIIRISRCRRYSRRSPRTATSTCCRRRREKASDERHSLS